MVAVLAGLMLRRRLRLCWSFAAYMLAALVGNSLASFWPDRFFTPSFYVLKQGLYDILKMMIALELAWRAFEAFPGAMRTARFVLLSLLVVSTVALAAFTPLSSFETLWEWEPSTATAGLWLLTSTALLVVWYQVPVHEWQRAIMLGLSLYQLVFVYALDLLGRYGWAAMHTVTSILDSAAYLALVIFWIWAAWRRDAVAPATAPAARPA
jgi:hypothetical protein